jgi:nucleoporin SEH1
MIQTGLIQSAHNDLVTDVAYDFYGLRLATCSLDQRYAYLLRPFLRDILR